MIEAHITLIDATLIGPVGFAEVVAVGSRSLDKAAAFIEETGLKATAMAFGSYDEVMADPRVQAVYIPLPAGLHVEWVKKACDHGKHILLEKPIALVRTLLRSHAHCSTMCKCQHGLSLKLCACMCIYSSVDAAMSIAVLRANPSVDSPGQSVCLFVCGQMVEVCASHFHVFRCLCEGNPLLYASLLIATCRHLARSSPARA